MSVPGERQTKQKQTNEAKPKQMTFNQIVLYHSQGNIRIQVINNKQKIDILNNNQLIFSGHLFGTVVVS